MTFLNAKAQVADTAKVDTQKFAPVDVSPEAIGGFGKYFKYVSKNLKYPEVARKNKIEGKIVLTFIVERDGSFTDIKVVKSLSPETDAEAIRVLTDPKAPKWSPGLQNGKPVRVQYTLPFYFKL